MPSGHTHDRITLWTLPVIAGGTYFLTRDGELTLILAGAFLFSGLMFGPDLDTYSLQFKRWGCLRWMWVPYQKTLRHRCWLSHGLIIGTFVRVFYLAFFLFVGSVLAVAIAQLVWGIDWNWQHFALQALTLVKSKYLAEIIFCFCGLELGAMGHFLSDWLVSNYQAQRKKRLERSKVLRLKKTEPASTSSKFTKKKKQSSK